MDHRRPIEIPYSSCIISPHHNLKSNFYVFSHHVFIFISSTLPRTIFKSPYYLPMVLSSTVVGPTPSPRDWCHACRVQLHRHEGGMLVRHSSVRFMTRELQSAEKHDVASARLPAEGRERQKWHLHLFFHPWKCGRIVSLIGRTDTEDESGPRGNFGVLYRSHRPRVPMLPFLIGQAGSCGP